MDIWTKKKRSQVMSRIRSANTKPERLLRSLLHKEGFRFRLHRRDLPGKPDIVFVKDRLAVFVHGCFWHYHKDCREGRIPSTNSSFWETKLQNNIERDIRNLKQIKESGWHVIVIWECEVEKKPGKVLNKIKRFIKSRK